MSSKVTIIGSGLVGSAWSVLFARAGYAVVVYDIVQTQVDKALKNAEDRLKQLEELGLLKGQKTVDIMKLISGCNNMQNALENTIYVQECVPEDVEIKKKVFVEIDQYAPDDAVLASSTSCIAPSKFTNGLKHSENCIVAHPVNPPHLIPLVELVPAPYTKPSIVTQARAIMEKIGQSPIVVKKEVNGFILNRLQYALLMEAWRLVEDGVATATDVDTAISHGLGTRWSFMGPFQTIDLNANGVLDYCERYGENISNICREQESTRQLKGSATAKAIDEEFRKKTPLASLSQKSLWRDNQLAALAVHRAKMESQDDSLAKRVRED